MTQMSPATPKTILVADSDDFFRVRLSEALIQRGHKTKVASDGTEALKIIETSMSDIDFLVMDHYLPPTDSFWILQTIQDSEFASKFPILILCKDNINTMEIDELKANGADGFMTKDFTHDQISYQVDQIIYQPVHLRVNPRISVSIPAKFLHGGRTEESRILNLSEQGLFWYSRVKHKAGTEIVVNFKLPGQDRNMEIKGVVMRYRRMGELNNLFTEVGLQLIEMTERDKADMKNFLDAQIQNIYPKA
jgi:CheY-like chemotaxis protein